MAKKNWFATTSKILVGIGGINWALVGLFNFNLVEKIFGLGTLTDLIYVVVGVGAIKLFWDMIK